MSDLYRRTADLLRTIAVKELKLLNHEKEIINAAAHMLDNVSEFSKMQDMIEKEILENNAMERAKANTN